MALFRRTPADAELTRIKEAFRRVASELDVAQRALLAAVPTARHPGDPLPNALDAFLTGLTHAENQMVGWRTPRTEDLWLRCSAALTEARAEVLRLRSEPGDLGFEALNARLGDIIAVLEEFADAAAAIRRVR